MMNRSGPGSDGERVSIIAADMPIDTTRSPIEPLLSAFRKLAQRREDVRLVLTGRRCPSEIYSVFNELDRHELTHIASFHPYYDRCERFPHKKPECDVWISRNTPGGVITDSYLERRLQQGDSDRPKYALFFTSFHPGKQEGNSTLMRRWLDHLKAAGYIVHVVYYMYDTGSVQTDMRRAALYEYDLYKEVPVVSKQTGANYNGLNVHVDDWCGVEAMEAVSELCDRYEYDIAITNYPWMSAVFDRVHAYTRKILLTHDSFVDRNRRMLEQGYPESGWISIDQEGERIACQRSDVVVAMQEQEAEGFRRLVDPDRVQVIGPIFDRVACGFPEAGRKLRIGYFGSSNWVNEQNLGEYLKHWAANDRLRQQSEILIGGGVCETLKDFVPASLLSKVSPTMIGRVEKPADFFSRCDLIINPERGGTGIKIKTLEALAHGCGVITTRGGSVGLDSHAEYHNAEDFAALADITSDLLDAPEHVPQIRAECGEIYERYVRTQRARMNDLLGDAIATPESLTVTPPLASSSGAEGDSSDHATQASPVSGEDQSSPLVSIVIPFYGVEAFIEDCIRSVLRQDYPRLEIIFVDDQSPDNARAIVEKYMLDDPRISLVTHEMNQGLGPARNTGVRHASGEYIFFLDSDDYLASPRAISTLVREAQASGCGVVVGSCDRVMSDGQRLGFDRDFDRTQNGRPGEVVSGEDAYLGASFIPGGRYVPMRAWGTLIDRFLYLDSGLEYPPAEHEDLPHTPFLYHYAGKVLYIPDIVVTYRDRSDSISNTGWNSAKIRRQALIWRCIRSNIERFGLQRHMGNTAIKTAEHLVMKLRQNGIRHGAEEAVIETLEEILKDASGELDRGLLFYTLDSLRGVMEFQKFDADLYKRVTRGIPTQCMVEYYRHRLGNPPAPLPAIPISDQPDITEDQSTPARVAQQIEIHSKIARQANNDRESEALIQQLRSQAPRSLVDFPSMLTEGDFAVYFNAGKDFRFRGAIVDAGCFVGGTTMSLVQGLLQNPLTESHHEQMRGLIRVYDLFQIDDDYILGHLQKNYPNHDFSTQRSFLGVFEDNLSAHEEMLDVRPGDVMLSGYQDDEDIEILGVDLCKALPVTDYVVRTFFPRLMTDALVIQQDFIHQYHPHIHLSMMLLDDCFELEHEMRWGGSLSFRLRKPITAEIIEHRFGSDTGWYRQINRNTSLLRSLIERMHFDENRWVMLQVLAVYLSNMGDYEYARCIYQEAQDRFPHYQIPAEVGRITGIEAVTA